MSNERRSERGRIQEGKGAAAASGLALSARIGRLALAGMLVAVGGLPLMPLRAEADPQAASEAPVALESAAEGLESLAGAADPELADALDEPFPTNGDIVADENDIASSQALPSKNPTIPVDSFPTAYRRVGDPSVAPVRNQAPWGTCWGFGALGALEQSLLTQYPALSPSEMGLSVRQLMWTCSTPVTASDTIAGRAIDPDQAGEGVHSSITGGYIPAVGAALASWRGSALAAELPYRDAAGAYSSELSNWAIQPRQLSLADVHLTGYRTILSPLDIGEELTDADRAYNEAHPDSPIALSTSFNPKGVEAVKYAIMESGGVVLMFNADQSLPGEGDESSARFMNYETGGVYHAHYYASAGANHFVTVVGWDDSFSREGFGAEKPSRDGAFLCKNSWGVGAWGQAEGDFPTRVRTEIGGAEVIAKLSMIDRAKRLFALRDPQTNEVLVTNLSLDAQARSQGEALVDEQGTLYPLRKTQKYPDSPTWDGYFWLSYEDATILRVNALDGALADDTSSIYYADHNYQYDFSGSFAPIQLGEVLDPFQDAAFSSMGFGGAKVAATPQNTATVANVFTAVGTERLSQYGITITHPDSQVDVAVYADLADPTDPTSGTKFELPHGYFDNAGYYVIRIPPDVAVNLDPGETFSIAATQTYAGSDGLTHSALPLEVASAVFGDAFSGNPWHATLGAGESFVKVGEGGSWIDLASRYDADPAAKGDSFGNVLLKAFTVDAEATPVPDVVGRTGEEGTALLEDDGFSVSIEEAYSDAVEKGRIVRQSPEAGELAYRTAADAAAGRPAAEVTVWVSLGPDPSKQPQDPAPQATRASETLEKEGSAGASGSAPTPDTSDEPLALGLSAGSGALALCALVALLRARRRERS